MHRLRISLLCVSVGSDATVLHFRRIAERVRWGGGRLRQVACLSDLLCDDRSGGFGDLASSVDEAILGRKIYLTVPSSGIVGARRQNDRSMG